MKEKILRSLIGLLLGSTVYGCVDIKGPMLGDLHPSEVLSSARMRSSAIMIAQGDSHKIAIDMIAMNGDTIPIRQENIIWTSLETRIVSVTPTGTIYGVKVSSTPIRVTVAYTHGYATKFDTVSVYVTPGRIDANEIKLVSLDSMRTGGNGSAPFPRVRVDLYKNGALVEKGSSIPIHVDPPITAVAAIRDGPDGEPVYRIKNDKIFLGKFWVRSSLNLYGNEINDSILFTGLHDSYITALGFFEPSESHRPIDLDTLPVMNYQICAQHMIMNQSSRTIDILFSDSASVEPPCDVSKPIPLLDFYASSGSYISRGIIAGGNILNFAPGSIAFRKTRTSGIVTYRTRNSATKEFYPFFVGHFRQIDIQN